MTLEEQEKFLRSMSAKDFLGLGTTQVVYVREIEFMGKVHYSVCSADGQALTLAKSRELAEQAILQTEFEPVILH